MGTCILRTKRALILAVLLTAGLSPSQGRAAGFVYHFGNFFEGTSPVTSPPWSSALFEDVAPGTVSLTISNPGLTGSEFISEMFFNLNPSLNPSSLQFTFINGASDVTPPTVLTGVNFEKADGAGYYDIVFGFDPAKKGRFAAGDFVTYQISGIPTLTVADFVYLAVPAGASGPFLAVAHVQSIGPKRESGWVSPMAATPVPVPEPAAAGLFAIGTALGLLCRFKKNSRQS
jgi:hypothetical protein